MKIATYNVRVDTDYDRDWQWEYRKKIVSELINYHNWTLCSVQEVRPNQVDDLNRLTNYTCLSAERDGDGKGEGLAILYKDQDLEKLESGSFWLSETPEEPSIHPDAGYPRIALWGIFHEKKLDYTFLVINVHLDHISEAARFSGMSVVLEYMKDKISSYPTLLMGDFNAEKDEDIHKLLENSFYDVKEKGQHYGPKGTFQNFEYNRPWSKLEEIDYIYANSWSIKQTAILTDSIDGRYPSDHFPLEVELDREER